MIHLRPVRAEGYSSVRLDTARPAAPEFRRPRGIREARRPEGACFRQQIVDPRGSARPAVTLEVCLVIIAQHEQMAVLGLSKGGVPAQFSKEVPCEQQGKRLGLWGRLRTSRRP